MKKHNKNLSGINFRAFPYRGCLTRAAKKLGITPQNIRSAYIRRNPEVIEAVTKEVVKINKIIRNGNVAEEEVNGFTATKHIN